MLLDLTEQSGQPDLEEPTGRGHRIRQPIQKYKNFELTSTIPFNISNALVSEELFQETGETSPTIIPPNHPSTTPPPEYRMSVFDVANWKRTPKNGLGLYKTYWTPELMPHDPDFYTSSDDLGDNDNSILTEELPTTSLVQQESLFPFPNWSAFRLGEWFWSDHNDKSRESFRDLRSIVGSQDFKPEDIREANWSHIDTILTADSDGRNSESTIWTDDGSSWETSTVTIDIPFNSSSVAPGHLQYSISEFRHRQLLPLIRDKLTRGVGAESFHIVPYDLRWKPRADSEDVRVYGELYHSQAFLNEYKEIQVRH